MQVIELNVCGLVPCEPMERVLEAISKLSPPDRLDVLIEREPFPLYDILDRRGYLHCIAPRPDARYNLLIWHGA